MKITRSSVAIALFFCAISYGYTVNDSGLSSLFNSAFYTNFLERFKTTGAIAPSSRFLAREITKHIAREAIPGKPLHISDIGAGDGVFAAALADQLEEAKIDYYIHAVDIDDTFLAALRHRFRDNKRVIIHNVDIIKASDARAFGFAASFKFDVIISGLPHYADFFSARDVQAIFSNYKKLLKDGGLLRWFSYIAAPTFTEIKHAYSHAEEILPAVYRIVRDYVICDPIDESKEQLQQCRNDFRALCSDFDKKCAVIDAFKQKNQVQLSDAILNFPLARVYECRVFFPKLFAKKYPVGMHSSSRLQVAVAA